MGKSSDDWGLDEGFEGMIEEDIFGDSSKCKKLSAGRVLCRSLNRLGSNRLWSLDIYSLRSIR